MTLVPAGITMAKFLAAAAPQAAATTHRVVHHPFLHLLYSCGLVGLFLVSVVDSSFVPLPLPGITDIMIIVLAAQHHSWLLLILFGTAGSALGGYFSYEVGQRGGMAFLKKHVPRRIFNHVCSWMENHAIFSVAVPAILPPPMPLSPFVLAAGAVNMSRKKFMIAFTASRAFRHTVAAWLGIHYGRHIVQLWNSVSAKYATPVLIVIWVAIGLSCFVAFRKLYKTTRTVRVRRAELLDRPTA